MNTTTIHRLIAEHIKTMPDFSARHWATGNINHTPPAQGLWQRLSIQTASSIMSGMADKPMTRQRGAVVVQVFGRLNTGESAIIAQADNIAQHLGYYSHEHLELLTPTVTTVGSDGDFYQVNVRVPYRYK
ncbi:hypothetical protein B0181_11595 [Moraxella caviae]|uniref:Phage protein n=1 Tax=Moraxella caviae TaxID=34060 RepID=A0A1S9ZSZ3_9GAMM|nr:phage tail terminator-like protein [Moraxella caviae]OOR86635.1 hypothetical protein B0181_11595 [Moraxella caviae]STZ14518.1 Uncharacterised protein [Moraxella caviae]VEW11302.1 Uncharacterised protein [Moraxella caviae]